MLKSFFQMRYDEFHDILINEFSDLVLTNGIYDKMPYNMWRAFNSTSHKDYDIVAIDWNEKEVHIEFEDGSYHVFPTHDGSFGQFMDREIRSGRWRDPWYYGYEEEYEHDLDKAAMPMSSTLITPITDYVGKLKSGSGVISISPRPAESVEFCVDTKVDKAEFARLEEQMENMKAYVDNAITNITNEKNEKEISTMKGFNFDFGPVNSNDVRLSMYGLAVKNKAGTYVSYDAESGEIMDVDIFNFEGSNFLYKMPVAMKDIAVGDVVIHHRAPMFVTGFSHDSKGLIVIDVVSGERKEIMLAKSPFGFNFATKVVNFLGNAFNGAASAEDPFGNMWMLMAMSDENKDMKELFPFMLMANGGMNTMNPMMFYCLMGKENVDPMLMAMMMGAFNPAPAPAHECHCGGNCGNN